MRQVRRLPARGPVLLVPGQQVWVQRVREPAPWTEQARPVQGWVRWRGPEQPVQAQARKRKERALPAPIL